MARPSKNNADYFGHDAGMRNHRKIKAIRSKFGIQGYAIWVMFLEVLTESEENRFHDNDLEIELLAGDFGVSVTEIRQLLDYCIKLELLFVDNDSIYSKTLDDKLKSVYEKRIAAREKAKTQPRTNGSFCDRNPDQSRIAVTGKPESKGKVKESKKNTTTKGEVEEFSNEIKDPEFLVKNRQEFKDQLHDRNPPQDWQSIGQILKSDRMIRENVQMNNKFSDHEYDQAVERFISDQQATLKPIKSESDCRSHFMRWSPNWRLLSGMTAQASTQKSRVPHFDANDPVPRNPVL